MTINAHALALASGSKGFDCDVHISSSTAQRFKRAQYDHVARYIRRDPVNPNDLTPDEVEIILDAGLQLVIVQHCPRPGWRPNEALGRKYGETAMRECLRLGVPGGFNVVLDLEGVAQGVAHEDVIAYCNAWYAPVAADGYVAMIYLGYDCGLTNREAYYALKFSHYWGAYNVDVVPAVRGYQMQQRERKIADIPTGIGRDFAFDVNHVQLDKLRGLPIALSRVDFTDVESGSMSTA